METKGPGQSYGQGQYQNGRRPCAAEYPDISLRLIGAGGSVVNLLIRKRFEYAAILKCWAVSECLNAVDAA